MNRVTGGVSTMGKGLVVIGLGIAVVGVLFLLADRAGLHLGRLPGDISVERPGFRLYFPLGTSILISILLSLVLWLMTRRGS